MRAVWPSRGSIAIINSDAKRAPVLPDPDGLTSAPVDLWRRTPYDHPHTGLSTVDTGGRATADGCDAVYTDSPFAGNVSPGRDLDGRAFNRLWEYRTHPVR